jgi:iron complex outermembrane receptor protein
VERSTGITPEAQVAWLPMLGASYVRDLSGVVLKWRAAYGSGIRPVYSLTRAASWMGRSVAQAARSLQPESQSGVEAGFDLLMGRALALHVTRFDQRASGLIQPVAVTTLTPTTSGRYVRTMSYQLENVGAITNRGWELQGSTQVDRLTLAGTLALVDSRVARVAWGYRGDLRVGDRMLDVPARTASLTATWTAARWSLGTGVTRAEDWIGYDRLAIGQALGESERERDVGGVMLRNYWLHYGGVTRLRGNVNYRLVRGFTLQVSGDNLLNVQRGAPDNATVTAGRTLSFGLRTTF